MKRTMVKVFRLRMEVARVDEMEVGVVNGPADIAKVCQDIANADREMAGIVCLDLENRIIGKEIVHIGTLNTTTAAIRDMFKLALLMNAAKIWLVHNHPICPEGPEEISPSGPDRNFTDVARRAGQLLGVEVVDHVVLAMGGEEMFCSIREWEGKEREKTRKLPMFDAAEGKWVVVDSLSDGLAVVSERKEV